MTTKTKTASTKPAPGRGNTAPTLPKVLQTQVKDDVDHDDDGVIAKPNGSTFTKLSAAERRELTPAAREEYRERYRAWRVSQGMRVSKDARTFAFERLNRAHKTLKAIEKLFSADSALQLERELFATVHRAVGEIGTARTDVNDLPQSWKSRGLARRPNIEIGSFVTLRPKQGEQYAPIFGRADVQLEVQKLTGKFAVLRPTTGDGPTLAIELSKLQLVTLAKPAPTQAAAE